MQAEVQTARIAIGGQPGLVSIIVAAYNAERYIGETVDSILRQSHQQIEIIVVDDGSTDATVEVVRKCGSRVQCLRQQNSGGPSAPRNRGATLARGEFLVFFDSDDIMAADRVKDQLTVFARDPELVAVAMDYRNFDSAGDYSHTHFDTCIQLRALLNGAEGGARWDRDRARDMLLIENFGCTCAMMFRRDAFLSAGGFDERLVVGEDMELLFRVAALGPIGVLDKVGFRRRLHETNVSNRKEFNLREKIRSRRMMLEGEDAVHRRAVLRERIADYYGQLADLLSRSSALESMRALRMAHAYGKSWLAIDTARILTKVVLSLARMPGSRMGAAPMKKRG